MDDFWYSIWGFLSIVGIIIFCFIGVIFIADKIRTQTINELTPDIHALGYDDHVEVQIFCEIISVSLENFIASKGLQKQYEAFRNGEDTKFMQEARVKKKATDAQASGQATGLATGLAIGMSVRR